MHYERLKTYSQQLMCAVLSFVILVLAGCSSIIPSDEFLAEPWLAGHEDNIQGGGLRTAGVNRPSNGQSPTGFIAVIENEPTNISVSNGEVQRNIGDLKSAGAANGNLNERVELSFNNDSLDYVVKQLLGGLLAANYIAAEKLEGTVTFRTEEPIPRLLIPSILRDILARHGYVMKLFNGVYHIGTQETIAVLENNAASGVSGEFVSQVINLNRGDAEEMAAVVASILPPGGTVTPVKTTNSLVLRLSPVDVKPVTDLIKALVDSGIGNNLVAVVPLRESSPEKVAASINAYYTSLDTRPQMIPLIIPLENQQALLIGAKNQRIMRNARTLIAGLDKDNRDTPSLRIIPLKHLPATDIANQLNAIFANMGAESSDAATPDRQSALNSSQDPRSTDANTGGDSVSAPSIIRSSDGRGQASPTAAHFEQQRADGSLLPKADATTPQADQGISIVPDTRNNALLVYGTFRQFARIREVVRALDLPLAQVVIEATIVEVDLTEDLNYGVQAFLRGEGYSIRSSKTSTAVDPGGAGGVAVFDIDFGNTTASFVLNALKAVTNVKIISSPYLTVLDGRPARLSVGDQIPFLTKQTAATATGTTTTTNEIEVRDVGIILQVTPNIRADNSVVLNIQQEVSSAKTAAVGQELTPIIQQRSINSDIVVHSGKTVLLGGLIQDRNTKVTTGVPVLSDVPVLGNFFKQTSDKTDRTELVVMITPRVVRRSSQLDNITRLIKARLSIP